MFFFNEMSQNCEKCPWQTSQTSRWRIRFAGFTWQTVQNSKIINFHLYKTERKQHTLTFKKLKQAQYLALLFVHLFKLKYIFLPKTLPVCRAVDLVKVSGVHLSYTVHSAVLRQQTWSILGVIPTFLTWLCLLYKVPCTDCVFFCCIHVLHTAVVWLIDLSEVLWKVLHLMNGKRKKLDFRFFVASWSEL